MENYYFGSCHCKKVKFKFYSKDAVEVLICNCSICLPIDYHHLIVPHSKFKLISGNDYIISYLWQTKKAKHMFCKICGTKSFYQPRSHPNAYSINIKCVNNPPTIEKKVVFNGKDFDQALSDLKN